MQQKMADLPQSRIVPGEPPFTHVGVDYFGPFHVKFGRSRVKRYGVIFTCLVTRAVHIEVAHSLDTDSFVNALRRFIARHGKPSEIKSDNGTNFTSAENELKHSIRQWNQQKVHDFLLQQEVSWHFNPPSASHMEEVSDDARDPNALTPNHLLMLKSNDCYPPGIFSNKDSYSKKRWKQIQYLADLFWKRWVKEYLPTLQQRQKWLTPKRNLRENDIVLIVEKPLPRGAWRLGRVVDVHIGRDGLVRSAKVKTSQSELVRPVDKLCLLEGSEENPADDELSTD
eukprot:gene8360-biopygen6187